MGNARLDRAEAFTNNKVWRVEERSCRFELVSRREEVVGEPNMGRNNATFAIETPAFRLIQCVRSLTVAL